RPPLLARLRRRLLRDLLLRPGRRAPGGHQLPRASAEADVRLGRRGEALGSLPRAPGEALRVDLRLRQLGRLAEARMMEVEELEHRVGVGVARGEGRQIEARLDEAKDRGVVVDRV